MPLLIVAVTRGGGIVTREENIALMRAHGTVVWLCRPLEDMICDVQQGNRPMLAGDKETRMRTLYAQREAIEKTIDHLNFKISRYDAALETGELRWD